MPDKSDDELRVALINYAIALSRTRQKIKAADLEEKAKQSMGVINEGTKLILKNLTSLDEIVEKQLEDTIDKKCKDSSNDLVDKMFQENERIYFRLEDNSVSSIEPSVRKVLSNNSYEITDYKGGYASNDDGKNICKIGKLLKKLGAKDTLVSAFAADPCRVEKNMMVVLTRSAVDISRGSHMRGWASCRADESSAAISGVSEYHTGILAAYLVNENDPYIHDPLSRLYLKPFDNTDAYSIIKESYTGPDGSTVYFTFNPIGLHYPAFADAINRFADEQLNHKNYGRFYLRSGCESYRELKERKRLPHNPEDALNALNVKFSKNADGQITVKKDIDMKNMGLSSLPDLSSVVLKGAIDVSGNKILSLEGLPQNPVKELRADRTLISSFVGCPAQVKERFSYIFSAWLASTCNKPAAKEYEYGGNHCSSEGTVVANCVGPIEDPNAFLRFKRK